MADRVVLHIGTMKSGTTYLQGVLSSGALEPVGGFYPGGTFGAQTSAVLGLRRGPGHGRPASWQDLVAEVRGRDGVAVFSQEFLSFVGRRRARELVESFGGTPVEVVLTVRDQHGAMPAQWQSFTRNRGTDDWPTYVGRLLAMDQEDPRDPSKAVKSFRRAQDVPAILRRWTRHPDLSGVTAVVVPPAGAAPTELWRRFCEAAGLGFREPPVAAAKSNESLGYASCDALRRINAEVATLDKRQYTRARAALLQALLPLRAEEGRPLLDRAGTALARRLNREIVASVEHHGVRLVGSAGELRTEEAVDEPAPAPAPDPQQVRRAVEAAWTTCVSPEAPPGRSLEELTAELGEHLVERFGG